MDNLEGVGAPVRPEEDIVDESRMQEGGVVTNHTCGQHAPEPNSPQPIHKKP